MIKSSTFAVALAASTFLFIGTAHAQSAETFSDPAIANGLSTLAPAALREAQDCLQADGTSRAVRACTKTLQAAAPLPDIKAEILARRGISQLSMGRFDKAADDFQRAGSLDGDNMMAALGDGFAAIMQNDHDRALARFQDCSDSEGVAALSAYGMGLSYQMHGDTESAREAFLAALDLRPGWDAVEEQLAML